ncbi:MAG: preprotein translocase subunit SecE [Acidobacteria bacterium 21-70-11]|nr:MAG: preprotein translocase subunit SecE [Acidobacteria bacterium 21-70-11]OYW06437.1 MAG: preprotein translocase subunit SecE [Acidobacteria bacterium 37-71-11]HQT94973.1 preprotein translocase subunit SecE [Thermoanaerobaculaceae bacterium]
MNWWHRLQTFLREVIVETKKVTWPGRDEVVSTTVVVIAASFIFGIFLYVCDLAFSQLVTVVIKFLS